MKTRSTDYFHGTGRKSALKGKPASGRIARLLIGQGHGFIRLRDREIFFHRRDLLDGTAFNDLQIGDPVRFELLEDSVSGARALCVTRLPR
jgi:hypothetical protein